MLRERLQPREITAMQSIAFLGTGLMGRPMAQRLLAAGSSLVVWNRTAEKSRPLIAQGARWASTPAHAVAGADLVITMMTDARAVAAALFESGAIDAMKRGAVVVDMSTTSPTDAREHAARLAASGIGYFDAPVSGGTRGAAEGTLAIMAGGDAELIARLTPLLAPMGTVRRVGPVGTGQLCKLANQLIVAVTIGAVAEALILAEKGGADPAAVRDALRGGFAESRILAEHGQRMLARNFTPGGTVNNQMKDLNAAVSVAGQLGIALPLLETVHEQFGQLQSSGSGALDHSALFLQIERLNEGQ
jgi:2-hydroxy-3-oxopropionate reductase